MSEPRTVTVTGGSRGLGAALVQTFLDAGDRVATCSRAPTPETTAWSTDSAVRDRFLHVTCDLTDSGDRSRFVDEAQNRFGVVDVLVNNAGVAREGVLGLAQAADIDAVIDLNLRATIDITRMITRRMLTKGSGRVINISSVVGLSGYRGLAVYSTTKAALDGFTRALARELGPRGITVNSVAPGYLRTELTASLGAGHLDQIVRRTPAQRLGEPEDVAAAVAYLASPAAAFVSGHVLVVDGGLTA